MGTGLLAPVVGQQLAPPRVGLLATLTALGQGELRMADGIAWQPETCDLGGVFDPAMCTPPQTTIEPRDTEAIEEATAFGIWADDKCSTFDFDRPRRDLARRGLLATESYQVAHEFWTGELARAATPDWPNKYLASLDSDVLTTSPAATTHALACLEQGIAETGHGRRGMIHATPQLVTHWQAGGALRREGGLILTVLDTIVVPDAGYTGSGQYGQAPSAGSQWAYATEVIQVRLGAIEYVADDAFSAESVDRLSNDIVVRAQRLALIQWDHCIHAAVEVDLGLCGVGGS